MIFLRIFKLIRKSQKIMDYFSTFFLNFTSNKPKIKIYQKNVLFLLRFCITFLLS